MEPIKLIWDIRSLDAQEVTDGLIKKLKDYIAANNIENTEVGYESIMSHYHVVYVKTTKNYMIELRDEFTPDRGEYIDPTA
ncbi:hypothetical protein N9Q76_00110 [Flavobacteriales bacterium]|nr:hypothetical protein [Flavobacteriales bacterium]